MLYLNQFRLVGRLHCAPKFITRESKFKTRQGEPEMWVLAKLTIHTFENPKLPKKSKRRKNSNILIDVEFRGKIAMAIQKLNLSRFDRVLVGGALSADLWKDRRGFSRKTFSIDGESFHLISRENERKKVHHRNIPNDEYEGLKMAEQLCRQYGLMPPEVEEKIAELMDESVDFDHDSVEPGS